MYSTSHFLVFTFSLLLASTVTVSRTISPEPTTSLLDVSVALQQTVAILSIEPLVQQTLSFSSVNSSSSSSSSLFSLPLHSRETVFKTQHKDYKSLLHSRLARDSARVDSLLTKLQLALNGINGQDLKPLENQILPEDLSTPVVSGISQGSGEYFSRVGVGSPPKQFYMVLDTGSDINWIQCQPCSDCYQQSDPIYDPSLSSTHRAVSCNSPQCGALDTSACRGSSCLYQVSYGDGSFTVGEFITETVSFGNSGAIQNVAIGCGHDNEGLFVGAAGLLGLGGGELSLTKQVKATSFSYCLVDRNSDKSGNLEFNSPFPANSVSAPLLKSTKIDTFYYVGLSGFSVGGQRVQIPPSVIELDQSGNGGVIVDCGTAVTRLPTQAYNALRDAFVKSTSTLKSTKGYALFDTCYDFSGLSRVTVPTVSFQFTGGNSLDLPAKNYLIPVDSTGTFCFAFAPTTSSMSIIGNVQQQGIRVNFNLANNRVGFTPRSC
ncbi:protein ASPARTIC PROTEASE IN GUARD CELL 1-like [Mangifera indica]|uniref:protein ASPARTIC PROTEASE IN GUARD CELL 1-like n=1 Tax=Mangifera indica TaxID=29780 RepID=UPI001CFC24F5|nr:protein ASPARTIC PROTEASE IN GUARD CELL 1-like [Mangifera indica]